MFIHHLVSVTTGVTDVTWLIKYQLKRPVLDELEKHGGHTHSYVIFYGRPK